MQPQSTVPAAVLARFWARVDKSGPVPEQHPEYGNCWEWRGAVDGDGYARLGFAGASLHASHIAYTIGSGAPTPEGFVACHTCDNRLCVRGDEGGTYEINGVLRPRFGHIWIGTSADNTADKMAKGRHVGAPSAELHHFARLSQDDVVALVSAYGRGLATSDELARIYSVSPHHVTRLARGDRWRAEGVPVVARRKATYNRPVRLTDDQRAEVVRLILAGGMTQRDIAQRLGVGKSSVGNIAKSMAGSAP